MPSASGKAPRTPPRPSTNFSPASSCEVNALRRASIENTRVRADEAELLDDGLELTADGTDRLGPRRRFQRKLDRDASTRDDPTTFDGGNVHPIRQQFNGD